MWGSEFHLISAIENRKFGNWHSSIREGIVLNDYENL